MAQNIIFFQYIKLFKCISLCLLLSSKPHDPILIELVTTCRFSVLDLSHLDLSNKASYAA